MRINVYVLRTAFVYAGLEFRGDLVDGWTVDRKGCHGDHVGSQLNKCWQELEQPLRHRRPSLLALLIYVNEFASLSPLSLSFPLSRARARSLTLLAWEGFNRRTCHGMRNSNWINHVNPVSFSRATFTYKSYNELHYFPRNVKKCIHIFKSYTLSWISFKYL